MSESTITSLLALSDGLFFMFNETGELCDWNQTVIEQTSMGPDELATMTPDNLLADDGNSLQAAVDTLEEGDSTTVETILLTASSERRHYEFTLQKLAADSEGTYGAIGQDITERKRTERQREVIFDRMSDGVFAVDTDWQITYANEFGGKVITNAMGRELTADEIEGLHLWEKIPEAVDTVFYEKYHEAVTTQEPVTFEEYYQPLDIWFDVRAYPSETGLSVYFDDVTERYRQREAADRRERILQEMYEIISDHNRPFEEQVQSLLELGRGELGTRYGTLSRIVGDEYHFEIVASDDDTIQSGDVGDLSATNCELVASNEETVVFGDVKRDAPGETDRAGFTEWGISCYIGAPVYAETGVYGTFCFYDTDPREGQFSGWEQTLVDLMSRWVSYELQRQRATEQVEAKTEQLEAKNNQLEQFAEIVSHDLRNPLGVLDGWLEAAEETGSEDAFDRCFNAIDRMNTLIDDILTLAQAGSVIDEPEVIDVATIATAAWESVYTSEAALTIEIDSTVSADETRLQQFFENIFRNSIEHGTTDSEDESDSNETISITVGELQDGFFIEDDGCGIPPDERETIFESGYTTTDDGTGFGLAIVAEIADAHGWKLTATEGTTGGARFECSEV